jgi:hypothetical protein
VVHETPLTGLVTVRSRFVRSVALTRDWNREDAVEGYLLTPVGLEILERLATALQGKSAARAWTLTGPYGSGKSAFALFAAQTLCGGPSAGPARSVVKEHIPELWKGLFHGTAPLAKSSLCPVLLSGSREPLETALATGLLRALKERGIRPPRGLAGFSEEVAERRARLAGIFEESLRLVAKNGDRGLLLVVDELGKYLEYAASRPDGGDVFALQTLSEVAARSETPFLILTVLHQSVEQYAAHVSVARRQEWAKIQGRFEEVAFEEPTEQILRLLARALEPLGTCDAGVALGRHGKGLAADAWRLGFRTGTLERREIVELLASCVPLHPTTALLLGPLFKRLAQNERSLFAFLTSGEPFGFQEFLTRGAWAKSGPTYRLDALYDYVTTALGGSLYSQHRGKHWAEVQSALERLRDSPLLQVRVAKAIGLVQAVGYLAGLPASKDFLRFALRGEARDREIDDAIAALERRSVIVYRRHADSYALWEGSDVNVEARIEAARRAVDPGRQLTSYLADLTPPAPLVARKHSHRTGTLRYFEASYANAVGLPALLAKDFGTADGRVVYCLPVTPEDRQTIEATLTVAPAPGVIAALPGEVGELKEACVALACLHWVGQNTPELAGDATARRELRARLAAAEQALSAQIRRLFLPSADGRCRWFYEGKEQSLTSPRHLNAFLSNVCDRVYVSTPTWTNELINRRSLSSSAAAARRNLIQAMIEHQEEETLGIQGTPPERSMYDSILAASGMHRKDGEVWGFRPPRRTSNAWQAWKAVEGFFKCAEERQRPVADLFSLLRSPPYGLKDGVLPVLLAAALLHHDSEVALYERGTFIPVLTTAVFEIILRSPELFEVQYCRIVGPRAAVFKKYAAMLSSTTGTSEDEPTLLTVVRPLLKFVQKLPDYVAKTEKVSPTAKAVFGILKESRQPDHLLFTDLPAACSAQPFGTRGPTNPGKVEEFFGTLRSALSELQQAYPRLQTEVGQLVISAFGLTGPLAQARAELTHRAKVVSELAVEQKLQTFLLRVVELSADDAMWLESLAALLGGKPTRVWSDEDRARFEASVALTARTFRHFEALAFEMEQAGAPILDGDDQALRVAVTLPRQAEVERVVRIPAKFTGRAAEAQASVRRALEAAGVLDNRELCAAVLARVVCELLEEKPE